MRADFWTPSCNMSRTIFFLPFLVKKKKYISHYNIVQQHFRRKYSLQGYLTQMEI